MNVTDVSTTWAVVIFRVKVILYRQWMVFMSLVIDLIGQLNCHVIGCKTLQSVVSQIVSSVYCLSVLASLISRL